MRQILRLILKSKAYAYFMKNIIWRIRISNYYSDFKGSQYTEAYGKIHEGDIVLCIDKKKLSTMLIPGEFSHAALFLGKDAPFEVAEMVHTGYNKAYFFDVCKESDRVVIMRCMMFDPDYIEKVVSSAIGFQHSTYDIAFSMGIESLYCSELVYQADFERRLKLDLSDLAGLGVEYISPDGLLYADNCFCVYDSEGVYTGLMGHEILRMNEDKKMIEKHQELNFWF